MAVHVGLTPENKGAKYEVSAVRWHEEYDVNSEANDIALLTLETAMTFDGNAQPACLPSRPVEAYMGQSMLITGVDSGANMRSFTAYITRTVKGKLL